MMDSAIADPVGQLTMAVVRPMLIANSVTERVEHAWPYCAVLPRPIAVIGRWLRLIKGGEK
jgi:hypothetical protein